MCIFDGTTKHDDITAAVIGCKGSNETIVNLSTEFTILELIILRNGSTVMNKFETGPVRQKRGKCLDQLLMVHLFYVLKLLSCENE